MIFRMSRHSVAVRAGGRNIEYAHVYLCYGEPFSAMWLQSAMFAHKLADILAKCGSYDTDVKLEWTGEKDAPFISIELNPAEIKKVVEILCAHKTEFSYDIRKIWTQIKSHFIFQYSSIINTGFIIYISNSQMFISKSVFLY